MDREMMDNQRGGITKVLPSRHKRAPSHCRRGVPAALRFRATAQTCRAFPLKRSGAFRSNAASPPAFTVSERPRRLQGLSAQTQRGLSAQTRRPRRVTVSERPRRHAGPSAQTQRGLSAQTRRGRRVYNARAGCNTFKLHPKGGGPLFMSLDTPQLSRRHPACIP